MGIECAGSCVGGGAMVKAECSCHMNVALSIGEVRYARVQRAGRANDCSVVAAGINSVARRRLDLPATKLNRGVHMPSNHYEVSGKVTCSNAPGRKLWMRCIWPRRQAGQQRNERPVSCSYRSR